MLHTVDTTMPLRLRPGPKGGEIFHHDGITTYTFEPGWQMAYPNVAQSVRDRAPQQIKPSEALRRAREILAAAGVKADIVPRTPEWKPGDVVVVTYPTGQPCTYVRTPVVWSGSECASKTDEHVNEMYAQGKAKPVLEAGGKPFPLSRLP